MGMKHISGPSKAPISATNELNTGTVLAIIKAIMATPRVQLIQVIQWVGVFLLKCREPRRICTNMNFAGICAFDQKVNHLLQIERGFLQVVQSRVAFFLDELTWEQMVVVTINPGRAKP